MSGLFVQRTPSFSIISHEDEKTVPNAPEKGRSRPIRYPNIFLDIDEPYTRHLIQRAFAQRPGYHVKLGPGSGMDAVSMPSDCDFQWAEYERIDWDAVLAGHHPASSYFVRKGISRKAQLAHYTHRHVCKCPDSILATAIPKTVVIDTWSVWAESVENCGGGLADIVESMSSSSGVNQRQRLEKCLEAARVAMSDAETAYEQGGDEPVWILKGSTVNKGAGIYIVHLYEQVIDHCWTEPDIREWVLQRYIASPLLLRRRKFHIRAYIVAVGDLHVYLAEDCLALCSGTCYRVTDTSNLLAHITNTAYQDRDPGFNEKDCVLLWNDASTEKILIEDGRCKTREEAHQRIQKTLDDMGAIVEQLFSAYATEFGVFSPIEGCFEHYGLDFIVDQAWNVFLLEVNPGPDFKQTGQRLESAIERLMGSTIDVALTDPRSGYPDKVGSLRLVYEKERRPRRKEERPQVS